MAYEASWKPDKGKLRPKQNCRAAILPKLLLLVSRILKLMLHSLGAVLLNNNGGHSAVSCLSHPSFHRKGMSQILRVAASRPVLLGILQECIYLKARGYGALPGGSRDRPLLRCLDATHFRT